MTSIDVITYLHPNEKHLNRCIVGLKRQNVKFNWYLLCFEAPIINFKGLEPIVVILPTTIKNKAAAYNYILPQLKSTYIAYNDADDRSLNNRFHLQMEF